MGKFTAQDLLAFVWFLAGLGVIVVLAMGIALIIAGCAVHTEHAVQPTPASWTLPLLYASCLAGETVRWPNGLRTVTVACPQRTLFLDRTTKLEIDPDALDFRRVK